MTAPREELRDELLAVIAAAPELAPDARDHLADVFLDRLEQEYRLVPRAETVSAERRTPRSRLPGAFPAFWLVIPAVLGLALLFALVSTTAFVLVHPPIFLFVILIMLFVRFRFWGPRRRMYR